MAERGSLFFKRAFRPLELLLTFFVIVMFAEVVIDVALRYIFRKSIPWGSELDQTLLVWMTFLGSALAYLKNEHMAVNLFPSSVRSPFARKLLYRFTHLCILFFILAGIYGGWRVTMDTWVMTTTAMRLPVGVLYLSVPIGCLLMLPVAIRNIVFGAAETEEKG